ncbi:MAG: glycosyltransferase family 4 protein [Nitrospirae bacterium]|nr:glycosyltransferase family 4 protein [Nitrospirota bacterium]
MKPCIGLVVPSLEQGGGVPAVARFVKDVVLSSDRYDLKLISLATSAQDASSVGLSRPGSWWRGATSFQGTWEGLPFVSVGAVAGELEFQRYLPRRVLAEAVADCDLLQVICGSPASAYAVCGLGKPVSVQCATRARVERRRRDANPVGLAGWWRKGMTEITDRIDNWALHSVNAIQVENLWMYEYARELNDGREVDLRYAPPGVDAHSFCPGSERTLDRDPYVLCVGRLDDPRKNIGLLLEAYALIPLDIRSRMRLVLAGHAGPADSFWQRAEALGLRDRIAFLHHPSRDELISLYRQANLFALPSDEEGLGVVLLEAMACGIPVVSTRSGGPDSLITDGEDGYLVPLDDVAALADRIVRLHRNQGLNRMMGQRARATIEQRYAEEVARLAFLEVWDRLLQKAGHLCVA